MILEHIASPADVKELTVPQLKKLCGDLRRFLVESVARTGGHLVVSGFYVADRPIVESAARAAGLVPTAMAERDNWSSMTFVKEQ